MSTMLKINGQEKTFQDSLPETISALLEHLDINAAAVVAEIDGRIVERKHFAQTRLAEGQSIEPIRFVGGG